MQMRLEGIHRNTIRSLPFTSSSPADFPTLIHLHSSKEIQICQLLQLLYTLHIHFHHLLIIEQYPLPFHPLPQMCDIMPRMYGRPLVQDEPKKFVFGLDIFTTRDHSRGHRQMARCRCRFLAYIIRMVEKPLNSSFSIPRLHFGINEAIQKLGMI